MTVLLGVPSLFSAFAIIDDGNVDVDIDITQGVYQVSTHRKTIGLPTMSNGLIFNNPNINYAFVDFIDILLFIACQGKH
jgi:hypothetical protein